MLNAPSGVGALPHAEEHARAAEPEIIKLPAPETERGKPLMQALKERHTSREFSDRKLPLYVLSSLLWAAFGVNRSRPAGGRRRRPTNGTKWTYMLPPPTACISTTRATTR